MKIITRCVHQNLFLIYAHSYRLFDCKLSPYNSIIFVYLLDYILVKCIYIILPENTVILFKTN